MHWARGGRVRDQIAATANAYFWVAPCKICYEYLVRRSFRYWALGVTLLFGGCFPSLDGLVGARDAGALTDASRPDAPNSVTDAETPLSDGGVDALPAEAGGPFCSTHGGADTFCSDFDLNDLSVFQIVAANGSGAIALDTNDAGLSPPGSLVATIAARPVADAGAFSQAQVTWKSTPAQSSVAEVSFSMRIEKASTDRQANFVLFQFVGADRTYEARLAVDSDRTVYITEFDTKTLVVSEPFRTPKAIPTGTWMRIRYRVELLAANSGRADLDIDGVPAVTALAMKPAITSGNLRTSVGLPFCRAPNDSWTVRYDDLLIFPK